MYGVLVKRLRRRPLTAESGVRFPYTLLTVLGQPSPQKCRKPWRYGLWHFFSAQLAQRKMTADALKD